MTPPTVSVHIIAYQQREFLREAIESVLAQRYGALEICVGDDGSTDGTHEMLRDYAVRYPGVFQLALSTTNRGITANCNAAYALCTGQYVAWLGGDDLMCPGKLHAQVAYMAAHPEMSLSFHDQDVFESASGRTLYRLDHGGRSRRWRAPDGAALLLRNGVFCGSCSIMTRRDASPAAFDARIPITSDWLFWVETAARGDVGYLPGTYTRYRRHGANVSSAPTRAFEEAMLTLAIVDSRHPALLRATRDRRARLFLHEAVARFRRGARREGLALAREALRLGGGGSATAFTRAAWRTVRAR